MVMKQAKNGRKMNQKRQGKRLVGGKAQATCKRVNSKEVCGRTKAKIRVDKEIGA